jgi:hypothetical protein
MWLLTFLLLILLGLLGIQDWLKARRPDAARHLQPIEPFEGLIGAAGIVWGLLLLLHWLASAGALRFALGAMLVKLILALAMLALALILALPLLRSLFGEGDFIAHLSRFVDRMAPYKLGLGFACLVLALYSLVGHAF